MLFVPDEDYIRLPDHASTVTATTTTATTTTTTTTATDASNGERIDDGEDEDVFDENAVSPSILFASQAQYLGHSNQVKTRQHPVIGVYRTSCK